ncbi:MAG: YciI family protein [Firmicutes bacterium]|nr:YciI family protein [Bacillota bacterium]
MFVVAVLRMRDPDLNARHRPAHLEYLAELRREGKVWASGPFPDGQGGMVIYRTPDLETARALAEADPLVRTGARHLDLYRWQPFAPVPAIAEGEEGTG